MSRPLSIIIPTHKRAAILRQTLTHIEKQTVADQIEVIIVSDGPDEDTKKLATGTKQGTVRFFEIPKSQQGVARNRGIKEAKGDYVLFIGDDIFLEPEACAKHWERLQMSDNRAVLGFTTWDPSMEITPVMRWLERSGWQFGYPMIEQYRHRTLPSSLQHRFTYSSHISLPLAVAKAHPFREDVSLYGWEDIEWGQRLRDAGVELFYEPDAKALHHHHLTLEDSLKRMETLGVSAVHLSRIEPSLDRLPKGWKKWAYMLIALLPTMRGKHAKAFLSGIQKGTKTAS